MTIRNLGGRFPAGTIRDADIKKLAGSGELITEGFEQKSVKQACYELHASNIVYETAIEAEDKRVEVDPEGYVLRPHSYVTVIVQERIQLSSDVMARVLTKGQLFSVGILPVCTYADPGFAGRLGITLCNASHRYIVIRPGQAIAKIEFSILSTPVEHPYTGQHGYESEIWPIPVQFYATPQMLKAFSIRPNSIGEIQKSYGPVVASLQRRLSYYEKKVWLHISVTIVGFLALFWLGLKTNWMISVLLGVAANLITSLGQSIVATRTSYKLPWRQQ